MRNVAGAAADAWRQAGRAAGGAAEGAGHGRQLAAALAHQHAALRPAAFLPRPQGAPRTRPNRHIVFFLLLQVPSLSTPIPSNNCTRACESSRRGWLGAHVQISGLSAPIPLQ